MTEYIIVRFPRERDVYIGGVLNGKTNQRLRVPTGRHHIHLGNPKDYEPAYRRPYVKDTTLIKPMEVLFDEKS